MQTDVTNSINVILKDAAPTDDTPKAPRLADVAFQFDPTEPPPELNPVLSYTLPSGEKFGICEAGELITVIAAEGVGKSAFLGLIIAAIATGDPVEGWSAAASLNTVYLIDTEQTTNRIKRGLHKVLFNYHDKADLIRNRVHVVEFWKWEAAVRAANPGATASDVVRALYEQLPLNCAIIWDKLDSTVSGVNEEAEAKQVVYEFMEHLMKTGSIGITTEHIAKAAKGQGGRYSTGIGHIGSKLKQRTSGTLHLEPKDALVLMTAPKLRDAPPGRVRAYYRFESVAGHGYRLRRSDDQEPPEKDTELAELEEKLRETGKTTFSTKDIEVLANCSNDTANRKASALVDGKIAERYGKDGKAKQYRLIEHPPMFDDED